MEREGRPTSMSMQSNSHARKVNDVFRFFDVKTMSCGVCFFTWGNACGANCQSPSNRCEILGQRGMRSGLVQTFRPCVPAKAWVT